MPQNPTTPTRENDPEDQRKREDYERDEDECEHGLRELGENHHTRRHTKDAPQST